MSRKRGRKLMGEINVVPYIDVMLVLLIIFMVTAPMLSQGIKVDLPQAAAEPHTFLLKTLDTRGASGFSEPVTTFAHVQDARVTPPGKPTLKQPSWVITRRQLVVLPR